MKLYIFLLFIALFLQTSVVPFNLVLSLIICRAFVNEEQINYFIAFLVGIFLAILSVSNIGALPLGFLIIVKLVYLGKKLPLSKNIITVLITSFLLLSFMGFIESLLLGQNFELRKSITETIFVLPFYYILKFWEERFVVKPEVKLKIRSR